MNIKKIYRKIFPVGNRYLKFSLMIFIWHFFLLLIKISSRKNIPTGRINVAITHLSIKAMVILTKKLENYIDLSISDDDFFYIPETIFNRCRLIKLPQCAIPMFEFLVVRRPNITPYWHKLASCYFWIGDVPGVKNTYLKYVSKRNEIAQVDGIDIFNNRFFSSSYTFAIGHICILGFYSMRRILDGPNSIKNNLYINKSKVINSSLLGYIAPMLEIIDEVDSTSNSPDKYLDLEDPFLLMRNNNNEWEYFYDGCKKIISEWESKKKEPLLKLKQDHLDDGWNKLSLFGLNKDSWFVAIHIRDAKCNEIRHGNISDYILAIKKITSEGGWVVRLGDTTMPKLPRMKGVIDYAHSAIKSESMDVFLIGECRFFIGTNSGPAAAPGFFGKRCIQTNYAPIMYNVPYSKDILIPILFRSRKGGNIIPFHEYLKSTLAHAEYPESATKDQVEPIKNTPEEILAAVIEMMEIISSKNDLQLRNSINQRHFQLLCEKLNVEVRPLISEYFLRAHRDLLQLPHITYI